MTETTTTAVPNETTQTDNREETSKETNMSETAETRTFTYTLTASQMERLAELATTTITGKAKETGQKTLEEITYQAVERGISALLQTRTQYAKQREAMKLYKAAKQSR